MLERRSEMRRRTLLDGRLAINRLSTLDCVVRNMSAQGARLLCRIAPSVEIVRLEIKAVPGFKQTARVVWRRLEDCGVEFV
jgi:PilZ domain